MSNASGPMRPVEGSDTLDHVVSVAWVDAGPAAQRWVRTRVDALQAADRLAPVTVIVPNYYAGRQLRWTLARGGGVVNVRTMLIGDLATQLLVGMAAQPLPLTLVLEESAVREAVRRVGGVLSPLAHHRALHAALMRLFRELRRGEIVLDASASEMARAATETYEVFSTLIGGFADRTRMRERAAERLLSAPGAPAPLRELGAIVVCPLPRIDPADARLLAAVARWSPLHVAFARFDPSDALANALPTEGARLVLSALEAIGVQVKTDDAVSMEAAPTTAVIRAPDPAEEVREVVRSIARGLDGPSPTPLHRVAILYRQADPYASLVRESLSLTGLPWSALDGRSLAESRPGRAFLATVEIGDRDFAREAVLAWVDVAPSPQTRVPGSVWDRLSRAANVVRGAGQWRQRLSDYAARQQELATRRELESGETVAANTPAVAALRHEADLADRMLTVIAELEQSLAGPQTNGSWGQLVDWAERIWQRHCGGVDAWLELEHDFATDVAALLAELRDAEIIEQSNTVPLSLFVQTVRETLEARTRPVGSLGQGILVGPVQAVAGLAFDHAFIVGMTERAFPTPPAVDPFLPTGSTLTNAVRERQRAAERLAFCTAAAAADGGRLTLSTPDSLDGRRAFPSPWLLELAAAPSGRAPLLTSTFFDLRESEYEGWLRVVPSSLDGIRGAPRLADLEEHRLQLAAVSPSLRTDPIARRADLPLGQALEVLAARASADFSVFDGNLSDILVSAGDVQRLFDTARVISASGIEAWASCPFSFFLGRVLHVQQTQRPEDGWMVDPLERGSLVHRILERYFRTLQTRGRLAELTTYTGADRQLMDDVADECIADLERRGVTGHPLIWENTVATIRADLQVFLTRDESWRLTRVLYPTYFEQSFGFESHARSWPALALRVGDLEVAFRGMIDRIDLSADRTRAFLYDYKTGGASSYREMNEDPLMAGRHVQLALYRRAVLASMPELDEDEVDGAFWFVSSRGEFKMLPSEPGHHDTDRRLEEVLDVTARGIRGGYFPQVPGPETSRPGRFSWDNCVYCPYDRVCPAGRDAVWERKQESPGHVLHRGLVLLATVEPAEVEQP